MKPRGSYHAATTICGTADGGAASRTIILPVLGAGLFTYTNLPNAVTEFPVSGSVVRVPCNFLYSPIVLMTVNVGVAGSAGTKIGWQWSTDNVTFTNYLVDGSVDVIPIDSTGTKSISVCISDALRYAGNVYVRCVTFGGNGAADPQVQSLVLYGYYHPNNVGFTAPTLTSGSDCSQVWPLNVAASSTRQRRSYASGFNVTLTNRTWANQPAALTEYLNTTGNRSTFSTKSYEMCWVQWFGNFATAGFAGATYVWQTSVDGGSTWNYYDMSSGPTGAIDQTGVVQSNTVAISAARSSTAIQRLAGLGGNAVADPAWLNAAQYIGRFYYLDPTGAI